MGSYQWDIPADAEPKPCKGCGEEIYWIVTRRGKNMPVNPDGISHFETCSEADNFRKPKGPDEHGMFTEEQVRNAMRKAMRVFANELGIKTKRGGEA